MNNTLFFLHLAIPCLLLFSSIVYNRFPKLKIPLQLFQGFVGMISFATIELHTNWTGIFCTSLNKPLTLDQIVYDAFSKKEIPMPELKVSRILYDTISINKTIIVLPVNYVSFSKAKINYILLRYAEENTITKKENDKINKIIAEAKAHNKKILNPNKLRILLVENSIFRRIENNY